MTNLKCSRCGRFIPKKNINKGSHPEYGITWNWSCDNCGLMDGSP